MPEIDCRKFALHTGKIAAIYSWHGLAHVSKNAQIMHIQSETTDIYDRTKLRL